MQENQNRNSKNALKGGTVRIAICDDEQDDLDKIRDMVLSYDTAGVITMQTFASGAALLQGMKTGRYDIVFLDIGMEEPDGFEIARLIRQMPDPALVIFVTKSSAYVSRGYGIAFRYLNKPVSRELLYGALDAAIADIRADRLTLELPDGLLLLPVRDVTYIESSGHYIIVHTKNREYRARMSLKDVAGLLPHTIFLSCHASFLVNAAFINRVTKSDVFLTDGTVLPLSRQKKAAFNAKLNRFLGRWAR